MFSKKLMLALMIGIFFMSFASAVKPLTSVLSDEGFLVKPTQDSAIKTATNHSFEIHVFNVSNGRPITTGITCYMHLYHDTGGHIYEASKSTPDHMFDYGFDLIGENFTGRGEYEAKFQCNNSALGGESQLYFLVNDYGEELTDASSSNFNWSMGFMMILFLLALVGIFKTEHYIAKFTLYWITHFLFVIGTFSIWQFTEGYAIAYVGLSGVWRVLFYFSIYAVVPMMVLSGAWILYIHTFNEHFQNLLDKGEDTETAFRMTKKKKGGWFSGRNK